MNRFLHLSLLAALAPLFVPAAAAVDFQSEIRPILQKRCFKCHSGPRAKGSLRMDNNNYLIKRINTEEDAAFHPGHPEKSLAIKKASLPRSDTDAMPPPRRGDPLSTTELAMIKKWITEGARLESGGDDPGTPTTPTTEPAPPKADPDKLHEWSNTGGGSLKASFVKLEGKTITLKKEDGTEFTYPMSNLSPASRKLATELASGQ